MVRLSADVTGGEKMRAYLEQIEARVREHAVPPLRDGVRNVRNEAVAGIAKPPKTGRLYKKYQPRRLHRASAKGEYPAADTGDLMRSINDDDGYVSEEENGAVLASHVYADAEHAALLEYKAEEDGGRPFLRRALAVWAERILAAVKAAIIRAVRP